MTGILALLLTQALAADSVREDWLAFTKEGCDVTTLQSPAVTRVLRNTPFALAGRPFVSKDLHALFSADGDWYAPVKGEVSLNEADTACVAKLKAREDVLRSLHCLQGESQAALSTFPDVWRWHRMAQFKPWDETQKPPAKPTGDACKIQGGTASFVHWTIQIGGFETPDPSKLALPEGIRKTYEGAQSDEALAKANASVEAWLKGGKSVRWMVSSTNAEAHQGDDFYEYQVVRRCAGPDDFMGDDWVCFTYSLP